MNKKIPLITSHELVTALTEANPHTGDAKFFRALVKDAVRIAALIPTQDDSIEDLTKNFDFDLYKAKRWVEQQGLRLTDVWENIAVGLIKSTRTYDVASSHFRKRPKRSGLTISIQDAANDLAEFNPRRGDYHYFKNRLIDATDDSWIEPITSVLVENTNPLYDLVELIEWAQDHRFNISKTWLEQASILKAPLQVRRNYFAALNTSEPEPENSIEIAPLKEELEPLPWTIPMNPIEILSFEEVEQLLNEHHIKKPYQIIAHAGVGKFQGYIKDTPGLHIRRSKEYPKKEDQQHGVFAQRYEGYQRVAPEEIAKYWHNSHEAPFANLEQPIEIRCLAADAEHNRGLYFTIKCLQNALPKLLFLKSEIETFYGINKPIPPMQERSLPTTPDQEVSDIIETLLKPAIVEEKTVSEPKPKAPQLNSKMDELIESIFKESPDANNQEIWNSIRKRVKNEDDAVIFIEEITPWGKFAQITWGSPHSTKTQVLSQKSFQNKLALLRKKET